MQLTHPHTHLVHTVDCMYMYTCTTTHTHTHYSKCLSNTHTHTHTTANASQTHTHTHIHYIQGEKGLDLVTITQLLKRATNLLHMQNPPLAHTVYVYIHYSMLHMYTYCRHLSLLECFSVFFLSLSLPEVATISYAGHKAGREES